MKGHKLSGRMISVLINGIAMVLMTLVLVLNAVFLDSPVITVIAALCLLTLIAASFLRSRGMDKEITLGENALKSAHAQVESAIRTRDTYLTNISHDVRSPMNSIVGLCTLAEKSAGDPAKLADALSKIRKSSEVLLTVITDTLDMASLESGHTMVRTERTDLIACCEAALQAPRSMAAHKGVNLTCDLSGITDTLVSSDPERVTRVLYNLLHNAVTYTPVGGSVSLKAYQLPDKCAGRGTYVFEVKDNGIGMSKEFQRHMFEPFVKERPDALNTSAGAGLGLPLAKCFSDMLHSQLDVMSAPGEGTKVEFAVRLRLRSELTDPAEPGASLKGRRVLVAEDDDLNREIARDLLTDLGILAEEAENGAKAVELISSMEPGYYDAVLMDVQMPVMDGYEATSAIRALPDNRYKVLPIIAMTASALDRDKNRSFESGMNGHLSKPVDVKKLITALEGVIR